MLKLGEGGRDALAEVGVAAIEILGDEPTPANSLQTPSFW
jgi:hypothetical protein